MRFSIRIIFCLYAFTAITAVGQSGWRSSTVNAKGDLVAVYFTSDKKGWIAGDAGFLASTNDGGATWLPYELNTSEDINEIYFRNDDDGYLVAGRKMFVTSNGGRSWQETTLVRQGEIRSGTPEFLSIRFADRKRGLAIGSIWRKQGKEDVIVDSLVMRTEDGGSTWQRIAVPARGELYHLDYNGSSHAWIVGDHGVILASTDSGRTWRLQNSGTKLPLFNVDFRDDDNGFAVGKSGVILRTTDGGNRWQRIITSYPETLMRVDFADDKNGWIVGHRGTILRSSDKGLSWVKQESGTTKHLYGLFMMKKYGRAIGADGLLLEYTR